MPSHSCRQLHMDTRIKPNVLVTGTPGTGKTTLCEQVAERTGFVHIDVSHLATEKDLCEGRDEELNCLVIDEDQVCDEMEESMSSGGCLVDYHSCDFFPERWFDLVLVLQTDNTILYDRLEKRGYDQKKIQENVTCEIMHVVIEEARESYKEEIVQVLKSDTVEEMDTHVDNLCVWIEQNTKH